MQPSEASSIANLRTSGVMQRTPAEHAVSMGSSSGPSQPSASAAGPDQSLPGQAATPVCSACLSQQPHLQ